MASESQVPRSLRNWIFKSRRKSKKRQIEKGWTPSGRMKYAKRSARTRHRKCEWKLCIMPAKTKLLRNLFSVSSYFFFIFQFCVTKMKLLSNFATLRYVFFGFILFTCVRNARASTGIEFEIVLLLLLLLLLLLPALPVLCPRGRRSHSDTFYGSDMALFMQLPQLFVQLQIDLLSLCKIYSSLRMS